jgi:4-hydroxy-4-methyl-2-oxoglutarate aldolase
MEDQLAERLEHCYAGAVYDVMRSLGHPDCVLPPTIRPLDAQAKLAGPVFTVSGRAAPGSDGHQTLLAWTGLLNDSTMAHMGELSAETMQFRGVRGYIVDGGCRDCAFIEKIGFRVFCRYFTPIDVVGRWLPETFGQPIRVGTVEVKTGDYVYGDRDGIVVIPGDMAERVVTRVEQVMQTESLVRKAILHGIDPQEAYLKYGKF